MPNKEEKDNKDVDGIEKNEPRYPVANKMAMDDFDSCLASLISLFTLISITTLLLQRELATQKREII